MKRSVMASATQFNLPLSTESTVLPDGKQKELALALVELLIGAARESVGNLMRGGKDESEVDE
jgi:hypothetical protein